MRRPKDSAADLADLKKSIKEEEYVMSLDILKNVDVICATCIGAGADLLEKFKFPVVIIDGIVIYTILLIEVRKHTSYRACHFMCSSERCRARDHAGRSLPTSCTYLTT